MANKACNSMLFMSAIGIIIPTTAVQLSGNGSGDSDQTWVRGWQGHTVQRAGHAPPMRRWQLLVRCSWYVAPAGWCEAGLP